MDEHHRRCRPAQNGCHRKGNVWPTRTWAAAGPGSQKADELDAGGAGIEGGKLRIGSSFRAHAVTQILASLARRIVRRARST